MITALYCVGALLSLFYAAGLFFLQRGFSRLRSGNAERLPAITVLISARDEEDNIGVCLEAALAQNYPGELFEVIVINDRSADRTGQIVKELQPEHENLKLIEISQPHEWKAPKKWALESGIKQAKGEIIFTTDADCKPGVNWLRTMTRQFEEEVGMVAGFNPYESAPGTFHLVADILSLDYWAMSAVAAASAGLDFPVSCTGGNLAFRKSVFERLGGYGDNAKIMSGDDDLFLQRVREETAWQVRYCVAPDAHVPTKAPETFQIFWRQRFRYASKGLNYSPAVVIALIGVFLLNLLMAATFVTVLFFPFVAPLLVFSFALKSGGDFFFLKRAQPVFEAKLNPVVFLISAFLHPFYLVIAVIGAQFFSGKWK